MTTCRALLAVGSVAIASAFGCGQAGVTEMNPIMTTPAAPTAANTAHAGAGTSAPPVTPPMTPITAPPPPTAAGATGGAAGTSTAVVAGTSGAVTAGAMGVTITAGSPGTTAGAGGAIAPAIAGTSATAGSAMLAAGTSAPAGAGCPTGYSCVDPAKDAPVEGVMLADAAGKQITLSCSKGGMQYAECNNANPKASCPDLPNPVCANVTLAGTPVLTVCAQLCTP